MKLNIKKIKLLTISQEVEKTMKAGSTLVFMGRGSLTGANVRENNDGTSNVTYLLKPEIVDFREPETEVSIVDYKKVKKKSESQALRHRAFAISQDENVDYSADALYKSAIEEGHIFLDRILQKAKNG